MNKDSWTFPVFLVKQLKHSQPNVRKTCKKSMKKWRKKCVTSGRNWKRKWKVKRRQGEIYSHFIGHFLNYIIALLIDFSA